MKIILNSRIEAKFEENGAKLATAPSGARDANYLAPAFDQILIHFSKLKSIYQEK